MTQYSTLNVKLSNSQLNKLKSAIKIGTEVTLNLLSNLIGSSNDETNFLHKLLLTDTQVSKISKAFANGSSANIKFPKTPLSKMIQSGGFLTDISGITSGLYNIVNFPFRVLKSYSKGLNNIDTKNYKNNKNKNNLYIDAGLNMIGK